TEVTGNVRQFADDEALDLRLAGFAVVVVDAVIADQRIGHCHDLSLVGRVGDDFLIAGHAGVEHNFASRFTGGAKAAAGVDRAVFERQFRRPRRHRGTSRKWVKLCRIFFCIIRSARKKQRPLVVYCPCGTTRGGGSVGGVVAGGVPGGGGGGAGFGGCGMESGSGTTVCPRLRSTSPRLSTSSGRTPCA